MVVIDPSCPNIDWESLLRILLSSMGSPFTALCLDLGMVSRLRAVSREDASMRVQGARENQERQGPRSSRRVSCSRQALLRGQSMQRSS